MAERWRNVTAPDPERTADAIEELANRTLEGAMRVAICDPGSFVPRRVRGPNGDRTYESVESWGARACAVLVRARLGLDV